MLKAGLVPTAFGKASVGLVIHYVAVRNGGGIGWTQGSYNLASRKACVLPRLLQGLYKQARH